MYVILAPIEAGGFCYSALPRSRLSQLLLVSPGYGISSPDTCLSQSYMLEMVEHHASLASFQVGWRKPHLDNHLVLRYEPRKRERRKEGRMEKRKEGKKGGNEGGRRKEGERRKEGRKKSSMFSQVNCQSRMVFSIVAPKHHLERKPIQPSSVNNTVSILSDNAHIC